MDTPISRTHEYLIDCDIHQRDDSYQIIGNCEHGTLVAGVVKQINSNVRIFSFPVFNIKIVISADSNSSYQVLEIFYSSQGAEVSKLGLIAAALSAFLNSDSRVANFSMGVTLPVNVVARNNAIDFFSKVMKALRVQGSILVVAAGNAVPNHVGVDIDNDVTDLFAHFINLGVDNHSYVMDNIVAVAVVDQLGQLADFSYFGKKKVMLAALGEGIYSCSSPPNKYKRNNGTSFAAPQVAATLAMMMDHFPSETHTQIIDRLRSSVDPVRTLELTTISGGRLNIARALGMEP